MAKKKGIKVVKSQPKKKEVKIGDKVLEAKAFLEEGSRMLLAISRELEKANKSGNRFLTASREIDLINNHKVIV